MIFIFYEDKNAANITADHCSFHVKVTNEMRKLSFVFKYTICAFLIYFLFLSIFWFFCNPKIINLTLDNIKTCLNFKGCKCDVNPLIIDFQLDQRMMQLLLQTLLTITSNEPVLQKVMQLTLVFFVSLRFNIIVQLFFEQFNIDT